MERQRTQARAAARAGRATAGDEAYRSVLDTEGRTVFVGQSPDGYSAPARVVAVLADNEPERAGQVEVFLDRTPFYAESGGQMGDIGTIVTETGTALVYDTVSALPGLTSHRATVTGEIFAGQDALATIDGPRRDALRRNHTGTHLLHAALRTVLGDQVRQQGSLVAPDRLRFDFSHHGAGRPRGAGRRHHLGQRRRADRRRGDRGRDVEGRGRGHGRTGLLRRQVRRAGPGGAGRAPLVELCGGTHVGALGMIGPITVVSEASIGSNTRRIEAVTGTGALERMAERERLLAEAAVLLRTEPEHVGEAIERLLERQKAAEKSLEQARSRELRAEAASLVGRRRRRRGGGPTGRAESRTSLRDLAQSVRNQGGLRVVVLGGSPDGVKASLAVSWTDGSDEAAPRRRPGQADRPAAGRRRRRQTRAWLWPAARTRPASSGPSTRRAG